MSGHSHWATTKHAKAKTDAARGKIFSRIAKEIMLAAKVNGDPATNPALRTLVEKGRKANMPKDNIENAIKKGTGELAGAAAFEEITYEGYAAGGVGLIVNVLTDNKNRAAADVGHVFKRNGSDFATRGAVSRNFERKGQILIAADAKAGDTPVTEDFLMEIALEAGADDIKTTEDGFEITTAPADYQAVRAVADRYGLLVLEDGAQGFGGTVGSKRSCSFGDIATTSFFPAKPLGCYGDGGAVFTDNDEWAALIASYRVHGKGTFKYDNVRIGLNSRLDTVQAAVLQVKLKAFADYELDAINEAAARYTERLQGLSTPVIPEGYRSSWAQYTVRFASREERDAVQAALKAEGIPAMVYYPKPLHRQAAFADSQEDKCPVATSLCERVLSLPLHPYMGLEEIETVCNAIRKALR